MEGSRGTASRKSSTCGNETPCRSRSSTWNARDIVRVSCTARTEQWARLQAGVHGSASEWRAGGLRSLQLSQHRGVHGPAVAVAEAHTVDLACEGVGAGRKVGVMG